MCWLSIIADCVYRSLTKSSCSLKSLTLKRRVDEFNHQRGIILNRSTSLIEPDDIKRLENYETTGTCAGLNCFNICSCKCKGKVSV